MPLVGGSTNHHQGSGTSHRGILGSKRTRSNATGYASGTNGTVCPTFSSGDQSEGDGGGGGIANYSIAKSTGQDGTETGQITEGLLQMRMSAYAARLPPSRQATASHHQTSNVEKRERWVTGMISLVTGSQVSEQTDSKISAILDEQED